MVKNESLYHAALVKSKRLNLASPTANNTTRELLKEFGSFEGIFNSGQMSLDDNVTAVQKDIDKCGFDFETITVNDSRFPECLKHDGMSPVIYVRGDLSLLDKTSMAVIGTRNLFKVVDISEGKKVIQRLLDKEYVIVSGLAEGCDTLGHKYAIENGGRTIAVLGTPLNKFYPKSNKSLQEIIANEHLLVTPYPIGVRTFPSYFAHRNMITVGLSTEGIVVIRADDKSGTQNAIREADKTGKPIYALRGNLNCGYEWVNKYNIKIPNKIDGDK